VIHQKTGLNGFNQLYKIKTIPILQTSRQSRHNPADIYTPCCAGLHTAYKC